ncbi:MAG: TSUP family transporter, partial [Nitrospinaceae bacterium]|nr:TSUP family transporter [Nitrospinaceae bacterium]
MSTLDWSLASLILLLGGIIKGGIGFGLPAFSIPFLSLLLGPRDAVVMLSLSACLTNIDNVRRDFSEWRSISRVLPYFAVGIVCVPLGALFLQRGNPELVRLIIGLAVYGYLAVRR